MQAAIPQSGGMRVGAIQEANTMITYLLLLFFALLIVYIPRVPEIWFERFRHPAWQFFGLVIVFGVGDIYGWVHGVLASLAFALLISHAIMTKHDSFDSFDSFEDYLIRPNKGEKKHRWLSEKVLGENPFLIRDVPVSSYAIQDLSEVSMGTNHSSK